MKVFILLIFPFVFINTSAQEPGQPAYEVRYHCVFNKNFERGQDYIRFNAVLDLNTVLSRFYMLPEREESMQSNSMDIIIELDTFLRVIKDLHTNEIVFGEPSLDGKEKFFGDTLHPMHWELSDEKKFIDSMECYKANTFFRGRNYIAWYCPALPLTNGPWKLGGLPGLIIEAYEENKDLYFLASSIRSGTNQEIHPYHTGGLSYPTYPQYIQYWKDLIKKLDGALASQQSTPGCISCETKTKSKVYTWEKVLD